MMKARVSKRKSWHEETNRKFRAKEYNLCTWNLAKNFKSRIDHEKE